MFFHTTKIIGMEISNVPEKLSAHAELVNKYQKCLGKTIICSSKWSSIEEMITANNKFVHEVILEMCENLEMQKNVLEKLRYFAGLTTDYFARIHSKPNRFEQIVKGLKYFILDKISSYKKNEFGHTKSEPRCYVVDFILDNKYCPRIMYSYRITDVEKMKGKFSDFICDKSILLQSIVGKKTVDEWGIAGFIALVISYINDELLVPEVESLANKCLKKIASFFTEVQQKNDSKPPRICLTNWLNFFEKTLYFNVSTSRMYINSAMQQVFFKCEKNDCSLFSYFTDYEKAFAELGLLENKFYSLINGFMTSTTRKEWILLLQEVLKLSDSDLINLACELSDDFRQICFGIDRNSCSKTFCVCINTKKEMKFIKMNEMKFIKMNEIEVVKLKEQKKEFFEIVNGEKYNTERWTYDFNGNKILHETWEYDRNLNVIKYLILTKEDIERNEMAQNLKSI